MKRFMYFESTEGGMQNFDFSEFWELGFLYGFMTEDYMTEDLLLREWMESAEVGDCIPHRLGVAVRLKDE